MELRQPLAAKGGFPTLTGRKMVSGGFPWERTTQSEFTFPNLVTLLSKKCFINEMSSIDVVYRYFSA